MFFVFLSFSPYLFCCNQTQSITDETRLDENYDVLGNYPVVTCSSVFYSTIECNQQGDAFVTFNAESSDKNFLYFSFLLYLSSFFFIFLFSSSFVCFLFLLSDLFCFFFFAYAFPFFLFSFCLFSFTF